VGIITCLQCDDRKFQDCEDCVDKRPLCTCCLDEKRVQATQKQRRATERWHDSKKPPEEGVCVSHCDPGALAALRKLWEERGGHGKVIAGWSIDNPRLSFNFFEQRAQLRDYLGREPDDIDAFHGTNPANILSIAERGFDSGRRSGQVYGSGEYFAKDPEVSRMYSAGGQYVLVCRLSLGCESTDYSNSDGDHIWVPENQYYVISEASQALPCYILKFEHFHGDFAPQSYPKLDLALNSTWSTKVDERKRDVPKNRPCNMSMPETRFLWIGFLHNHISDEDLEIDVCNFLCTHIRGHAEIRQVEILQATYKKAHVVLSQPLPRALVHKLNKAEFVEDGQQRRVCVEDMNGSPGQKCPKWIAQYCRGRNLRYTQPCWCDHAVRPTERATYELTLIDLSSAKGEELTSKFLSSGSFHNGSPQVVAIHAVRNETLQQLQEKYRQYLKEKNKEEPAVLELFHGTNNEILDDVYQHGLQPPSDCKAADTCPISGGKGLCTTLCDNTCRHCVEPHAWDRCHMFGLGVYLADTAAKSHRYISRPQGREHRMIVCSVLGRSYEVAGHLKSGDVMHDVTTLRFLAGRNFEDMIDPVCRPCADQIQNFDTLFVKGLAHDCRPGFSVFNSEYIAFHPYQCLPKYQITYVL